MGIQRGGTGAKAATAPWLFAPTTTAVVRVLLLVPALRMVACSLTAPKLLNEHWVTGGCQYGSMPGTWLKDMPIKTQYAEGEKDLSTFHTDNHMMAWDADWATADYGNRWQPFNHACRMENLIKPVLDFTAPTSVEDSVKIMVLSDSLDTHVLQWVGEHHHRKFGARSDEVKRLNYSMYLHDRGPRLNYAVSTSGLSLFHMFLLSLDRTFGDPVLYDPLHRVAVAREHFDNILRDKTGITDRTFEPDAVVIHCNYWTLKTHTDELPNGMQTALNPDAFLLPNDYLEGYQRNLTLVALEARDKFPKSLLVMRTAPMVRHNPETGGIQGGPKIWAHKMWVWQLNEATRAVAAALNLPLVDEAMIAGGLTPSQSLFDDIHINEGLSWEVYNMVLNLVQDYQRELGRRIATIGGRVHRQLSAAPAPGGLPRRVLRWLLQ